MRFDPETLRVFASKHDEAATELETRLGSMPTSVDGGIAADGVAAIMSHVGGLVEALRRVHGSLGLSVDAIADDVDAHEDELVAQLTPVQKELDEQ